MSNINADYRKESLLKTVEKVCWQSFDGMGASESYSYAVMPLLYALVAHHHGKRFDVNSPDFSREYFLQIPLDYDFDEKGKSLLRRIAMLFPNLIPAKVSYCIADFYAANYELIDEFYTDIIECVLNIATSRGGRDVIEHTSSQSVTQLLYNIAMQKNAKGIYDPCAGLCSFVTIPGLEEVDFFGQEINEVTATMAAVRLDAHNSDATIIQGDALEEWNFNTDCNCLCTEPPLGMRIHKQFLNRNRYYSDNSVLFFEDLLIENFIKSSNLRSAIFVVTLSACSRHSNFSFTIRKTLCDKNFVDMVIELPAGAMPNTGVSTAVIVLDKDREGREIKFISASDCLKTVNRKDKTLDLDTIYLRISGKDKTQTAIVNVSETYSHDCSLSPHHFFPIEIKVEPGQKLVGMREIAMMIRPSRINNAVEGPMLAPSDLSASLPDFLISSVVPKQQAVDSDLNIVMIDKPCVFFNRSLEHFFIKKDDSPLYFRASMFHVFDVDSTKCSPEYFVLIVLQSQAIKLIREHDRSIRSRELSTVKLPFYENLDVQRNLIIRAYRETESEMKAKIEKLQVLRERSSDLLHTLGVTFNGMGAAIANMRAVINRDDDKFELPENSLQLDNPSKIDDEAMLEQLSTSIETLADSIKYAIRLINSNGADYQFVTAKLEIVDVERIINKYIEAWGHYGYRSFEIIQASQLSTYEPTLVEIDIEMFYTMLDCILTNAHQHGFCKKPDEGNLVTIELKPVEVSDTSEDEDSLDGKHCVLLRIGNNGEPLPEGFTLKDFITRGVAGLNSSQDGLGGDHINKIIKKFKGKLDIESSAKWLSFNVLIPIYVTPDETEFEDYEYKGYKSI